MEILWLIEILLIKAEIYFVRRVNGEKDNV